MLYRSRSPGILHCRQSHGSSRPDGALRTSLYSTAMKPKPCSPGRPALPPERKRSVAVFAYFTPEEAQRLQRRKRPGQSMSELVREALLGSPPAAAGLQPEMSSPATSAGARGPDPDEAEAAIRAYGREMEDREIYSRAALAIARKHPRRALAARDLARQRRMSPGHLVAWLREHGPLWNSA